MALLWADSAQARRKRLVNEALHVAERLDDPETSLYVLHASWLARWSSRDFARRQRDATELVGRSKALQEQETALVCHLFHLLTLLESGDTRGFEREAELFAALADRLRQPQSMWYARLLQGTKALLGGHFDDAERIAQEFSSMGAQIGDANAFHSLMSHLLLLRWERGRIGEFVGLAREGVRRFPAMVAWRAAFAWTLLQVGRIDEGRSEFDLVARRNFEDFPDRFDWPVATLFASEACCELRDTRRAEKLYEILLPIADRHLVTGLCVLSWGSASRQLGRLAATMSRPEQALVHFREAISSNERSGAKPWVAHTMVDYAQTLLCLQTKEAFAEARQVLRDAFGMATALGMVNLIARTEKLISQIPKRRAAT